MAGPVIVCGVGRLGSVVLDYLRDLGCPIVAVDKLVRAEQVDHGGVTWIQGDCRDSRVLAQAGLERAWGVLVLTNDDLVNLATVLTIRQQRPEVRIVVRCFHQDLMKRFAQLVPNVQVVSKSALAAPVFARTALAGETLATFPFGEETGQVSLVRLGIDHPLCGRTLEVIARQFHVYLLALRRSNCSGQEEQLLRAVNPQTPLRDGDELLVAGVQRDLEQLAACSPEEAAPGVNWGSRLRRWWRVVVRTIKEIEPPVKVVLAVFVTVVALSVLVHMVGMGWSLGAALFNTISVMATAADMHGQQLRAEWERVFISLLRVAGLVLTAALTALLTHYLVRARLQSVLAEQRIPDRGHVILCGLGNVGYRILEELRRGGSSVVVIERNEAAPLLRSARQLGAAVLIGDAASTSTLLQARLPTCQALIAATSNDLVNVNITLLARESAPKLRAVVRLEDAALAEQLRNTANIRYSLALNALVAPAIVGGLFQDRLLALFRYHQHLLAVVELQVSPDEVDLVDRQVRELADPWGFVPLALWREGRQARVVAIPEERLQIGDRLLAVWRQLDFSRFLRRQPVRAVESA